MRGNEILGRSVFSDLAQNKAKMGKAQQRSGLINQKTLTSPIKERWQSSVVPGAKRRLTTK